MIHDGSSINANIDQAYKYVQYTSIRDAIELLSYLPNGYYMGKTDIEGAFRMISIKESDQSKLGMTVFNKYYFDMNLPMGCGMSSKLFESFTTALEHIYNFYDQQCYVIHYLNDFLFINSSKESCEISMKLFITLCVN